MPLQYNGKNTILAKNLRKNATKQEKHLWYDFLKDYEIKFQRQRPIDEFIADFYCQKANLVIEIDGNQHYSQNGIQKDTENSPLGQHYFMSCTFAFLLR